MRCAPIARCSRRFGCVIRLPLRRRCLTIDHGTGADHARLVPAESTLGGTLFSGEPVCVIETRDIKIVPFSEVDEDFAATEGEGDGSLAYWQRAHTAFFGRECQRLGREFSLSAPVVCEKFAVVFRGSDRINPQCGSGSTAAAGS